MKRLTLLLVLSACGGGTELRPRAPEAQLSVITERTSPGGQLELLLTNSDEVAGGYNLCFSGAQIWEDGAWRPLTDGSLWPAQEACPAILHLLQPGAQAREVHELSETAPHGTYRLMTDILATEGQGANRLFSNSFVVE